MSAVAIPGKRGGRLLHEGGRTHFMTRRFDRGGGTDNQRHPMQTLCAMAHVDYKRKGTNAYSQLFGAIRDLRLPCPARKPIASASGTQPR